MGRDFSGRELRALDKGGSWTGRCSWYPSTHDGGGQLSHDPVGEVSPFCLGGAVSMDNNVSEREI